MSLPGWEGDEYTSLVLVEREDGSMSPMSELRRRLGHGSSLPLHERYHVHQEEGSGTVPGRKTGSVETNNQ